MKSYKKTIINNINKHFKKFILGFLMLGILFYVIKYYRNKENFNIHWDSLPDLKEIVKIENDIPNTIIPNTIIPNTIIPNNTSKQSNDKDLSCKDTNLDMMCSKCYMNYNFDCNKKNSVCNELIKSNLCETECGFSNPSIKYKYNRETVVYNTETNNRPFNYIDLYKDRNLNHIKNINSIQQCETICNMDPNCKKYEYNSVVNENKCILFDKIIIPTIDKLYKNNQPLQNYKDKSTTQNDALIYIGNKLQTLEKMDNKCYNKYNQNCVGPIEQQSLNIINKLHALDYKDCEIKCNLNDNCKSYTYTNDYEPENCHIYKDDISNLCNETPVNIDSLYPNAQAQTGINYIKL